MSDELPEKIEALLRLLASSHGGPDVRWANERDIRRIARLAIEEATREKGREIADLKQDVSCLYDSLNNEVNESAELRERLERAQGAVNVYAARFGRLEGDHALAIREAKEASNA